MKAIKSIAVQNTLNTADKCAWNFEQGLYIFCSEQKLAANIPIPPIQQGQTASDQNTLAVILG